MSGSGSTIAPDAPRGVERVQVAGDEEVVRAEHDDHDGVQGRMGVEQHRQGRQAAPPDRYGSSNAVVRPFRPSSITWTSSPSCS
ncbi:MAG: hypothetical protein U0V56_13215 [Actinomycetota bacterium]